MKDDHKNLLECRYHTTVSVSEFFLQEKIGSNSIISCWSIPSVISLIKISWRNPSLRNLVSSALQNLPIISYFPQLLSLINTKKISRKLSLEDLSYVLNVVNKAGGVSFLSKNEILDLPPTMAHLMMRLKRFKIEYNTEEYINEVLSSAEIRLLNNHNESTYLHSLSMMIACYEVGNNRQSFFYARKLINELYQELSYYELVGFFKFFLPKLESRVSDAMDVEYLKTCIFEIKQVYAITLFTLGQYAEAHVIYLSLAESKVLKVANEAKRKVIRCLEREGGDQARLAITKGEVYLKYYEGDKEDDGLGRAKLLRTIGWTHHSLGNADKALEASLMARDLLISTTAYKNKRWYQPLNADIKYNIARVNNTIGSAYEFKEDFEKSVAAHKECLKVMNKVSGKWASASLLNLSIVYRKRGDCFKAIKYAEKAKAMKEALCDYDDLPPVLYNLCFAHLRLFFQTCKQKEGKEKINAHLLRACECAQDGIDIRESQGSEKNILALHCVGVLAQFLACEKKYYDFQVFFTNAKYRDGKFSNNLECIKEFPVDDDKRGLLKKTLSVINAANGLNLDCVENVEKELPKVSDICKLIEVKNV